MKELKELLDNTNPENVDKTDWSKAWSSTYPILERYEKEINVSLYKEKLSLMLSEMMDEYGYSLTDAMLVIKDILYKEYKNRK